MIRLLGVLEDGAWHSLKEIAEEIGVPVKDLARYCETVSKHEFVEYEADSGRVRLGSELMGMIMKLKADEEAEAEWERIGVGTVIVPRGKSFQIQGVSIHNMTEQDLKFKFTFNKKPKEIVVSKV